MTTQIAMRGAVIMSPSGRAGGGPAPASQHIGWVWHSCRMSRTPHVGRWAAAGLALYAVFAAVVALAPVSYAGIVHGIARAVASVPGMGFFGSGWIEFAANIALFVPLGFLLTLVFRNPIIGPILGIAVSVAFELIQFVVPDRQPSVRDVISNALGAAIGALLAWLLVLRRRNASSDRGRGRRV